MPRGVAFRYGHGEFTGTSGDDVLTGTPAADTFDLTQGGIDTLVLDGDYSAGLTFTAAMMKNLETLRLGAGHGYKLTTIDTAVGGIDPHVRSGGLSLASFDSELATALGAARLGAHHAVLFDPSAGDFKGGSFLVVDTNGTAGYQAGQDIVIALTHAPHIDQLSVSDFI